MRLGKIFQQQMPRAGVGLPMGVEAARDQMIRHRGSDLAVEGDFLASRLPRTARTIRQPRLEDQEFRRAYGVLVTELKPENMRQQSIERALHHDVAHAALAEHAGLA